MITKKERKKKKKKKKQPRDGISRNHLSTFLYLRYYNPITFYSLDIYRSSRRTYDLRNTETIVIVSTGDTNIGLL